MRLMAIRHGGTDSAGTAPPGPWRQRIVTAVEGPNRGAPVAAIASTFNLLAGGVPALPTSGPDLLACLSGWLPPDREVDPDGAIPSSFVTWSKAGWDALAEVFGWLAPQASKAGKRIGIMPHARTVVSDPQACMTFLRAIEDPSVGLVIDPVAMLTPEMLPDAEDHLLRTYEALADHDRVWMFLMTNTRRSPDGRSLRPAPLHDGELDRDMLIETALRSLPRAMPVAMLEETLPRQLAAVRAAELRVGRE